MSEPDEKLIAVADVARLLNVAPITIRRNVPLVRVGRRTLVRASVVKRIIDGEARHAAS